MSFIPVMTRLNFQQPLLESSVLNDPSEIILICWFGAQETSILKKVNILVETVLHFFPGYLYE